MKYTASLFVAFFILLALPTLVHAGDVEYARVVERSDSEVLIKRNTLTTETWFMCQLGSLACVETPSTTHITSSAGTPAYMQAYRALLPSGASSLSRSPDGRYIAFYIPATESRGARTFGVMDTTSLSIFTKKLTISYWDLLTEGVRYYSFSPDSKSLIYIDDSKNNPTLYQVNLEKLTASELTSSKMFSREYSVADVVWKDENTIFFIANRDGTYAWALYEYSLKTSTLTKIADNVSYADNLWMMGTNLLFTYADELGVRPALYDTTTKSIRTFALPTTGALPIKGKAVKLAGALTGTFFLESSRNSDTLLVWLHGGPYRQASVGYHPYFSYGGYDWVMEKARLLNIGFLKIDYPGSAGRGRLFAESITKQVGVKDATETAAAVADFAKRNRYTKVYLMGNSYGGYLAMKMLVDKPGSYRGVMSIGGVADWTTMLTALDTSIFNKQFGGTVGDANANYKLYNDASIYNRVERLSGQKFILIHADNDMTIPYRQSEGLASYLTSLGKSNSLITMAGEDHVFKKPESFELLCQSVLGLVDRTSTCDL